VVNLSLSFEVSSRRFIYDGWNLVGEFNAAGGTSFGSIVRSYTWGLNIARSVTDAGGVGALLQIADYSSGNGYFPTYDGNGNITSYINGQSGSLAAVYEYSPYGEYLRASTYDSVMSTQPFRFSTKFTDLETNLVYYGKRYYRPNLGRFVNRDPAEESGGINCYAYCGNDSVDRHDELGLWFTEDFINQDGTLLYSVEIDDADPVYEGSFSVVVDAGFSQSPTTSTPSSPAATSTIGHTWSGPPAPPPWQPVGNNNPYGYNAWSFYESAASAFWTESGYNATTANQLSAEYYQLLSSDTSIHSRSVAYGQMAENLTTSEGSLWFQTASDITGIRGIGGAAIPISYLLSSDTRAFLQQGNAFLFGMNTMNYVLLSNNLGIPTITFTNNAINISLVGGNAGEWSNLTGLALDYQLVANEQAAVQFFISQYNGNITPIMADINNAFNSGFASRLIKRAIANTTFPTGAFDFDSETDRIMLGDEMLTLEQDRINHRHNVNPPRNPSGVRQQ